MTSGDSMAKRVAGRVSPEQLAAVVAKYQAGKSSRQLASEYHTSKTAVLRWLRRAGVSPRPSQREDGKALDIKPGQEFERLVAVKFWGTNTRGARCWLCRCKCGVLKPMPAYDLLNGRAVSCGCKAIEGGHTRTHGMKRSTEWRAWSCMKGRCHNPNNESYPAYGGRGLKVCDGWRNSFEAFHASLGPHPGQGYSLDRIDSTMGYHCGSCEQCITNGWVLNCRWATAADQARNRRSARLLEHAGETLCLADWSLRFGLSPGRVQQRLAKGWTVKRALETPVRPCSFGRSYVSLRSLSTPERRCWNAIRQRCKNPRSPSFPNYGGRGITVCERWDSFSAFLADMGRKPSPTHSLDRIDNDGPYSPENCRWATPAQQAANKRSVRLITYRGTTKTLTAWASGLGICPDTLKWRLSRWPKSRALTQLGKGA